MVDVTGATGRKVHAIVAACLVAFGLVAGLAVVPGGIAAADAATNGPVDLTPAEDLDGEGTAEEPYVVTNASELQAVSEELDAHYELGSDVDASGTENWNDGEGFEPLGTFTGEFDGNGYEISGLYIDRSEGSKDGADAALFTALDGAVLTDVGLVEADIIAAEGAESSSSADDGGDAAGFAVENDGEIRNSYVSDSEITAGTGGFSSTDHASHSGGDGGDAGGLVVTNRGSIHDSKTAASEITGGTAGDTGKGSGGGGGDAGGILVTNEGSVQNSYVADSDIVAPDGESGSSSSSDGGDGGDAGGAFVTNEGTVQDSYVGTSDVTAGEGGSSGSHGDDGDDGVVAGMIVANDGTAQSSYWDYTAASGLDDGDGVKSGDDDGVTALTTDEMTGDDALASMDGFDFGTTWLTVTDLSEGYPELWWESPTTVDGTITDALDGERIEGATVTVNPADDSDETGASGEFELGLKDGTTYELTVTATVDGFTITNATTFESNEGKTVNLALEPEYDGEGTASDPYQVRTPGDLQQMRYNLSAHYELESDIAASATENWNDGGGFEPLGDFHDPFEGTFDGNGHSIADLYVDRPNEDFVGLFGSLDTGAAVSNVGVENATVSGSWDVGVLVGYNRGTVTESYATGTVQGDPRVGGLVGFNTGEEATVSGSYATTTVVGGDLAGGLVGLNDLGEVTEAYATGTVTGGETVGGLAGRNDGVVRKSYATGSVEGDAAVGGLVGFNGDTVENSYWNDEAATVTEGGEEQDGHSDGGDPLKTVEMTGERVPEYMDGFDFDGGTWETVTAETEGADADGYPILGALDTEGQILTPEFDLYAGGEGTVEEPYEVADWYHLDNVRFTLDANFTLVADLDEGTGGYDDVANESTNDGNGFEPLGDAGERFEGEFDGDGHVIEGLSIDRGGETDVGLFGVVSGTVRNVTLVDADVHGTGSTRIAPPDGGLGGLVGTLEADGLVTGANVTAEVEGENVVGGLVGWNRGEVRHSVVAGSVDGDREVGGLVANNDGTVSNSSAAATVTGTGEVGGLVGHNPAGTVSNSYATGDVDGNFLAGGLVGWINNGGEVAESYATGDVTGDGEVGGLVGANNNEITTSFATGSVDVDDRADDPGGLIGDNAGTVEASYWDAEATGQESSAGLADDYGLATAEMSGYNATVFMDGLAFDLLVPVESSYPELGTNRQTDLAVASVDAGGSTVAATSPHVANGTDASTVTVEVVDSEGILVSGLEADRFDVALSGNATLDEPAETGTAGVYEFTVTSTEGETVDVAVDVDDERLDDGPEIAFETPAEASLSTLDVAGQGGDATIMEDDSSDVAVAVENTGDRSGTFTIELTVTNGDDVDETETVTLGGGQNETVTFEGATADLGPDEYDVTVADADGMASLSGTLTVERSESALEVDPFADQFPDRDEGHDYGTVEVTVAETAGVETDGLVISLEIEGDERGEVFDEANDSATFDGETVKFTFDVGVLDADEYTATVTADADNAEAVTETESFAVEPVADGTGPAGLPTASTGPADDDPDDEGPTVELVDVPHEVTVERGVEAVIDTVVRNDGDQEATTTVELELNPTYVEDVTLAPGEERTVAFGVDTVDLAGEVPYTVRVDDREERGRLVVEDREPAAFSVVGLDPESETVVRGDAVDVAADVTNEGGERATVTVELRLDGGAVETAEATLDPGETDRVQFENVDTTALGPGEYEYGIRLEDDEVRGTLTVETDADDASDGADTDDADAGVDSDIDADAGDDAGGGDGADDAVVDGDDSADGDGAGFGVVVALLALVGAGLPAVRHARA